jgi:hypothetical protein
VISVALALMLISIPTIEWSASEIKLAGNVNHEVAKLIQQQNSRSVVFMVAGTLNPDTLQWLIPSSRDSQNRFSSQALTIRDETSAINALENALTENDMLILRKFDRLGFPSDTLQTFMNDQIVKQRTLGWKPIELGDFNVWVKESDS